MLFHPRLLWRPSCFSVFFPFYFFLSSPARFPVISFSASLSLGPYYFPRLLFYTFLLALSFFPFSFVAISLALLLFSASSLSLLPLFFFVSLPFFVKDPRVPNISYFFVYLGLMLREPHVVEQPAGHSLGALLTWRCLLFSPYCCLRQSCPLVTHVHVDIVVRCLVRLVVGWLFVWSLVACLVV